MIKLLDLFKESTNPSVYKVTGKLIINTEERSLTDILSDLRAIAGVTIVQTRNIEDETDPKSKRHRVTLSIKMDPAPFKPFNRSSFKYILNQIKKVPSVLDAKFESEPVLVVDK
jgi:hypothetical protein